MGKPAMRSAASMAVEMLVTASSIETIVPREIPFAGTVTAPTFAGNLTGNGIGFTLADGSYSNPYYANWDSPPDYFEVFTLPATSTFSEVGVTFAATAVPEPGAIAVFGIGLLALSVPVVRARRQQSRKPKA